MKKLYKYVCDLYYGYIVEYMVLTDEQLEALDGMEVFLGDCCGKHSEVILTLNRADFEFIAQDETFINTFQFCNAGFSRYRMIESLCERINEMDEEDMTEREQRILDLFTHPHNKKATH